jgi:hypothetical protein
MDMNGEDDLRDLERRLARSLHAAAPRPAPDLADRLLSRTASVGQRRGWGHLAFAPALAAGAVVVTAVIVGLQLGNLLLPGDVGSDPSATAVQPFSSGAASPALTPSPTTEPSPSADLFPNGNQCTNDEFGFTVSYPGDWWANEEVVPEDPALSPIPACTYFGEQPVELRPNAGVSDEVAIIVGLADEPLGDYQPPYEVVESREATVDGRRATVEEGVWTEDTVFFAADDRSYGYSIHLPSGETLRVSTSSTATLGAYEDHKQILDRMMETLEFGGAGS